MFTPYDTAAVRGDSRKRHREPLALVSDSVEDPGGGEGKEGSEIYSAATTINSQRHVNVSGGNDGLLLDSGPGDGFSLDHRHRLGAPQPMASAVVLGTHQEGSEEGKYIDQGAHRQSTCTQFTQSISQW